MSAVRVQYRVVFGKGDEAVEGPDDAELVITIPVAKAHEDPNVTFMRGDLRPSGPTGALFEVLANGDVAAAFSRLAQR